MTGALGPPPGLIDAAALPVAVLVAAAAGLLSFASPCILPLVPGFLGYLSGNLGPRGSRGPAVGRSDPAGAVDNGTSGRTDGAKGATVTAPASHRSVLGASLFVSGFGVIFVLAASTAAAVGSMLRENQGLLLRAGGVLVLGCAALFAGLGPQRRLQMAWRPQAGLLGAPILGMVFALGWSPCMGPTLAAVLTLATSTGDRDLVTRGVVLAVAYTAGLGVPFVLTAAGISRIHRLSRWVSRRQRRIQLAGSLGLAVLGVLLVTGLWEGLITGLQTQLVNVWVSVL